MTASTMPGHSSDRPTSACRARPPSPPAARSADAPSRSTTATDTPASAKRVAVASPIPDPPPVTTATLPESDPIVSPLSWLVGCRATDLQLVLVGSPGGPGPVGVPAVTLLLSLIHISEPTRPY